ncbi:MAG: LysR family transcriptional regulator [Aliivibrio sp.]|uniref:LysR family transcriptional regulator n=1 Tax=Aliivibrio sp. TaxID=1872443 RepID=UPI001A486BB9|nr:LysR family transcriptional regulator [Aliivibrio sp.]
MNIKQLTALQAVIDTSSTSAAATQLGLSQSGVSRLLAQLEQELEIELFTRHKGRLVAKPEVEGLFRTVSELVDKADLLYQQASEIKKGTFVRELVKIAVPYTFASELIPKVVSKIMIANPGVVIEILTGSYRYIQQCIHSGEADIGFTRLYENPRFEFETVVTGTSVCVMPQDHPLCKLDSISAKDLDGVPLVLLGRQSTSRKDIDFFFYQHGIKPMTRIEAHSAGVACALVANGLGVSIANSVILCAVNHPELVFKPIEDLPRYTYGLISKMDKTPSVIHRCVLDELKLELTKLLST